MCSLHNCYTDVLPDYSVVNMAFSTKEDAETVFRESENMKMKGVEIIALYGKYGYNWERERRQKTGKDDLLILW